MAVERYRRSELSLLFIKLHHRHLRIAPEFLKAVQLTQKFPLRHRVVNR